MSKSYKLYAKGWIDKNGFIHDFTELKDVLQNILEIDKKIEDLSIEHKNLITQIDHDESRITNIEEQVSDLDSRIGVDDGENDTNLDDIQSKLATHSSNIAAMKLDISSNKSTLNSLNTKVTTINDDLTEIKKQISQLNANITAIMTSLNNKLDKTFVEEKTLNWKTSDGTEWIPDRVTTNDVETLLNGMIRYFNDMTQYCEQTHTRLDVVDEKLLVVDNTASRIDLLETTKLDKTHASTLTVPTFNSSTFDLTGFYSDIMNKDVDTYLNDVSKWIGAMMSALQGKY